MDFEEAGEYFDGKVVPHPEESEEDEGAVGNSSRSLRSYSLSSSVGCLIQCWRALHNKIFEFTKV